MNEENNNLNPNIENTVPSVEIPDNTSQVGYEQPAVAETPTVEPVETAPEVGYEQPAVVETPTVEPVETAPEVGYEQPAVAETPAVETVESTPQESYEAPVNTDAPVGLETPGAPTSQEVNETPVEPTTQMQDSNSQTESQSVATTQEPKKNNTLLFVIIGIVLLVAVAVGCFFMFGKKEDVNYENPTNKEETKQQIKYSDKVNFTSEIVEINSYYNKDKYLVANITNKNNVAVSYEINVELYDENNNLIKTEEEFLTHVEPNSNSTVAIELYDADDFATYKLFVDVTKEEYTKSQMKNIEIKTSDNEKVYSVQIFNNLSDEKIEVINAVVLFYKEGKIIKIDEVYGFDVMPGRSVSETYEYKDKYDAFEFDDCKVLVNEAYSSNY